MVAVSGWERQRGSGCDVIASLPEAERQADASLPCLTGLQGWAEWRGVLKNANTLSMQDQLTLTPGSFRA